MTNIFNQLRLNEARGLVHHRAIKVEKATVSLSHQEQLAFWLGNFLYLKLDHSLAGRVS